MSLSFAGRKLCGYNFKGQDLSGADFSYADIRGANFTNASLRGANFARARAGLQRRWLVPLTIVSWFLAGASGLCLGLTANLIAVALTPGIHILGLAALIGIGIFLAAMYRRGFSVALILGVIEIALAALVSSISAGVVASSVSFIIAGSIALALSGTILTIIATAMTFAVSGTVAGSIAVFVVLFSATASALATVVSSAGAIIPAIILVASLALASCYIGWCAFKGGERYKMIRVIAVAWAAMKGTSFRNADLTGANFSQTSLKGSDFRNSQLRHVIWYEAQELDQSRVDNSVIADPEIRNLLVTRDGYNKSYVNANLRGVNLRHANLINADLKRADLSDAILEGANLSGSNLKEVLALGTNFSGSNLTGACIEAWNIDHTTQLENVSCDYVYLLSCQQERRPLSGIFSPGDFTALFRNILNTVDLIFCPGVDWRAFTQAFKRIQAEYADLLIQSIENKGGDNIVVKIAASTDLDKSRIASQFLENYQLVLQDVEAKYRAELAAKEELIEIYKQQSNQLKILSEQLAHRPIVVDLGQQNEEK